MSLKARLQSDMKQALRAGDSARLGVLRLALAAVKQREVDSREELDDAGIEAVIGKMIKQGRDAARQFEEADRADLADKEKSEIGYLEQYLPEQLSEKELTALIAETIAATGASSVRDMGKVMGAIKAKAAGRADMSVVSSLVKAALEQ